MKEILRELKIKNEYFKITTQRLISDKQLKVLNNMQKEFTNIVSHEMKTPIYAIIGIGMHC
jgi:signal transduction histidine kinase